ncbi:MAG: hypothetical protein M1834_008252 [Cirrosporium novae-zelandiae]|nr:MAG: hypothetical protein M1834_008252 [Cirrosporium novae-zelandiae]
MAFAFNKVPPGAKISPAAFQVNVSNDQIQELQTLVKLSKIAPPTYEGLQQDRTYGITTEWLATAKEAWKNFNWRSMETHINSFPQFTYDIEGLKIHFVALFSQREDAVPIVLVHGWPGKRSFFEFLPLLSLIQEKYTPSTLPYHFVVPSLPGYTFSSGPPQDKNFGTEDVARIINQVMINLGFEAGYVAQGGDIGAKIVRILAVDYESCKVQPLSILNGQLISKVNACFMVKPPNVSDSSISEIERRGLDRAKWFASSGGGYRMEHGTRPSTIGNVLSTNPVALLAWIGEKFLDWVDEPLPLETILESVTLYWLTETFPRSIYHYREGFPPPKVMPAMDPRWYIRKPLGFSYFPMELVPTPRAWVETTGNLVFWNLHEKGGHFAALERPRDLAEDLIAFVEKI